MNRWRSVYGVLKNASLTLLLMVTGSFCVPAAPLPEWAWKNESSLNRKRQNTSYVFKVFKTEDNNHTRLHEGRFYPLLKYIGETYGADPDAMVLDSLSNGPYASSTYRISFPENGRTATVKAQRVDVYSAVDYNVNQDPVFEYYQLYAVSGKDAPVTFDDFQVGERSKGTAALMNVVAPGAGQLFKGHTFKGYTILGSEIALGVTAITQQVKANYYDRMAETATVGVDSYRNDAIGRRRIRNAALITMGGIWAYSLFDALVAESMPDISVSAPSGTQLTVAPASAGAGIALVFRF